MSGRVSSDGSKPFGGSKDSFGWEASLKSSEAPGKWGGISEILLFPDSFYLSTSCTGRREPGRIIPAPVPWDPVRIQHSPS